MSSPDDITRDQTNPQADAAASDDSGMADTGNTSVPRKRSLGSSSTAPMKKPRQKSTVQSRQIPKSIKDCSEEDIMLLKWKDSGKTWPEIKRKWRELTGEFVKASSLPNRYQRLKDNFCVLTQEDQRRMFVAKQKIEKDFEMNKWRMIAQSLADDGGEVYNPLALQRTYKRLMIAEGLELPAEVSDADFEVNDE